MRRLAALVREERIGAGAIEAQFDGAGGSEPARAIETEGGLAGSVELHLARHFASFGRELPPDGLYDRVLAEMRIP